MHATLPFFFLLSSEAVDRFPWIRESAQALNCLTAISDELKIKKREIPDATLEVLMWNPYHETVHESRYMLIGVRELAPNSLKVFAMTTGPSKVAEYLTGEATTDNDKRPMQNEKLYVKFHLASISGLMGQHYTCSLALESYNPKIS